MEQPHRPLAKCHVLFLGSSVPVEILQGVAALERPLMKCYPAHRRGEVEGIDSWLTIYTSGIQLQLVPKRGASPPVVWFPIQNLYVVAATKCVNYIDDSTGEIYDTKFLEMNEPDARKSSHPPLFSFIVRKTKGKQVLQCYSFITRDENSATMLVSASQYAFENKTGWSAIRPPDEVIYQEIVLREEDSDDDDDSTTTSEVQLINVDIDQQQNQQNALNDAIPSPGNQSQNISDSDMRQADADDAVIFPQKLVRKYKLEELKPRVNTIRQSMPFRPAIPTQPPPGQQVMIVRPLIRAPGTVRVKQTPPPPKIIRTPPLIVRMPPPPPVVHVVKTPPKIIRPPPQIITKMVRAPPPPPEIRYVRQPYPVYKEVPGPSPPPKVIREFVPGPTKVIKEPVPVAVPSPRPPPEVIHEVEVVREPYPVPVRGPPQPPEVIERVVREPYPVPVRGPPEPPRVVREVVREPPEVVEREVPVYIRQPPEIREVPVEVPVDYPVYTPVEVPVQVPIEVPYYLPLEIPIKEVHKHKRRSKPPKGYAAYDDRFYRGRSGGQSYFISDLPPHMNGEYHERHRPQQNGYRHRNSSGSSSDEERPNNYYRNGWYQDRPHSSSYRISRSNGVVITELPESPKPQRGKKSRENGENLYSPEREGQYKWRRSSKGKHKKNRAEENGDVEGYDFYRPEENSKKGKGHKKKGRESSPMGRENYYLKENQGKHGGPPRNWMHADQEYMNERAFSSSLAAQSIPDPDTVDGETNAYALNADHFHPSMYDKQMPGGLSSDGENMIPPAPPLPGTSGASRQVAGLY